MSNISALDSFTPTQQMSALQDPSAAADATESANNSFASMLAQMMATPAQADTAAQVAQPASPVAQGAAASGASAVPAVADAHSQALAAGNLAAAQQAHQSLSTDVQGAQETTEAHRHHRQHSGSSESQADQATTASSNPAAPAPTGAAGSHSLADALSPVSSDSMDPQLDSLLMGSA